MPMLCQATSGASDTSGMAWNSTPLVTSLLFGIAAHDAAAFSAAPVAIVIVACLASYLPARRAIRVSPLTALRVD